MNQKNTFEKIHDIISKELPKCAKLEETSHIADFIMDEINWLEIIIDIEVEFEIQIPDEELKNFKTIKDIMDSIDLKKSDNKN